MHIKSIRVKNFKSFKDEEFKLGMFNTVIGANASGKSNFISVLEFLRDMAIYGLDDAISLQGGTAYLMNMNIGPEENLVLNCDIIPRLLTEISSFFYDEKEEEVVRLYERPYEFQYSIEIKMNKTRPGYRVQSETCRSKTRVFARESRRTSARRKKSLLFKGTRVVERVGSRIQDEFTLDEPVPKGMDTVLSLMDYDPRVHRKGSILNLPGFRSPNVLRDLLAGISLYDFDPKKCKGASPITSKVTLEPDGSNMAIVLRRILSDKNAKRRFTLILQDLLPFIKDLSVERRKDKSLHANLKEVYLRKTLPAELMSDGTANLLALIAALFFESKSVIVIEEPERNLHPYLISRVVALMKDASLRQKRPVIITTHNPEVVKYAGIESLILLKRNKLGFSKAARPEEKDEVKTFLKNEFGLDELFVENLLG